MHTQTIARTFARRLRKARLNTNLSQTSLGQRVGTGQDSISHYEQGQSLPSVPTLVRLARALGVDIGYFFTDISAVGLSDQQRDALALAATLSPSALEYTTVFVEHMAAVQGQHVFLEGEAFDTTARLRLLIRDMEELEYELTRGKVSTSDALMKSLIVFTALALVGMEMDVHPIRAADLARHITRKASTLLEIGITGITCGLSANTS